MLYSRDKKELYPMLAEQLRSLTDGVPHLVANLANASALLYETLEDVNWVGFYLMKGGRLVLGPFQGKPACIEIPAGKGVCGAAVERDEVILVKNVHNFPGHIACSSASRSEIVVPVIWEDKVIAVLDIDSDQSDSFDETDQIFLEKIVELLPHQ